MNITIQTFGAFRQFGRNIDLELNAGACVSDIRQPLNAALNQYVAKFDIAGLIESSRFATDVEILSEDAILAAGSTITILPPVSGG
ncbi:MAG: MoaD/ThiS family protein [Rhizobiales bacterium]|nr:MoaD/ThiS family protein [Hyphomicrobiales bacterium]NRB15405.1 MoaD/ThiS family protein [Hyphomicrobiales bacterium]